MVISVFVLTISCVLGWIVANISLKLKHKSLITVLISLAVIGGYYFLYFKAQRLIQDLLAIITLFGGFVYMALLFAGFMLLPGWILGFCGYVSCFVGVNLFISVLEYLWLRKKGVAIFESL